MGNISRSFYNDYRSAKKSQSEATKPIIVQSITRAGVVSKMPGDAKRFSTMFDAEQYIANMRRNNPNLILNYRITDTTEAR